MNQDFVNYYSYWPDALSSDIHKDSCHCECFGSKSETFHFGKKDKDCHNTINMRAEEMYFTKK